MAKKPDVVKLPSAKLLQSLVSQSKSNAAEIAELKGDYGNVIAGAVKEHNLHAQAFKLVKKWAGYDAVKLMALLTHLDDYRQKLQLDKLAGDALDLEGESEGDESDGDDAGEAAPQSLSDVVAEGDKVIADTLAAKTVN